MNDIRISDSKLTITFDDNYFRGLYVYQLRDNTGRIVESGKFQVIK
jgi:outer membrane protein assembly factor BamB